MKIQITPTWEKVDSQKEGFAQFYYIFDKDVEKEWRGSGFESLNSGRKMAVRFYWLIAELNNGGLDQYFWNSSGDFASETIKDLRQIGQTSAADILDKAAAKLFGGSNIPPKTEKRRQKIEAYYGTHPFNDDDNSERLANMKQKESLEEETDELDNLQQGMVVAFVDWMRANSDQFGHIQIYG